MARSFAQNNGETYGKQKYSNIRCPKAHGQRNEKDERVPVLARQDTAHLSRADRRIGEILHLSI